MRMIDVRRFSRVLVCVVVFFIFMMHIGAQAPVKTDKEVVIGMCRPEVSQIKNIEQMYEKDIILRQRIKLVCFYHEDENTDYKPSYKYVEDNKLNWVTFKVIKGKVKMQDLFKENLWTSQFKEIMNSTDGIIFTGGWDFPPSIYGESQLLLAEVNTPVRNYYEASFLFHLLGGSQNPSFVPLLESRKDYAVLGICLGCQTMNIACGGTLYQDIPQQVYGFTTVEQVLKSGQDMIHSSRYVEALNYVEPDLPPAFHRIRFKKDGLFIEVMKMKESDNPFVLTAHHQSINKLGKDLSVIATSMDGKIVEAIEHKKYRNVLGIQFHPEPYVLYMKGRYYRKAPGEPVEFNLRNFLQDNPPTMEFHKKIWQWFSEVLGN
jgi:putative glutamine amidotransferase